MSDEVLQREIEAALDLDPSPEFLPRVRARIANERLKESWFGSASWQWAGAVATVMALATIAVWTLRDSKSAPSEARVAPPVETTSPSTEPARVLPEHVAGHESGVPNPESRVPGGSSVEASRPVTAPRSRVARATQPSDVVTPFEVVISGDESAALRRLFAGISSRRIETRALPDLAAALEPLAPIEEIVLDPITISPLAALSE